MISSARSISVTIHHGQWRSPWLTWTYSSSTSHSFRFVISHPSHSESTQINSHSEPCRLLSFDSADPGPGLLHDNVLPVSESGDLLRLGDWPLWSLRAFGLFLIKKDKYSPCSRSSSSPSSSSSSSYRLSFPTLVLSVTFQLGCHKFTVFFPPLLTSNKHSVSVIPEFYGLLYV